MAPVRRRSRSQRGRSAGTQPTIAPAAVRSSRRRTGAASNGTGCESAARGWTLNRDPPSDAGGTTRRTSPRRLRDPPGAVGSPRELGLRAFDGLPDDVFDVDGVDVEGVADVDGPDLRAEVGLEVQLAADVSAGGLAVLADHDEGGQEDRFEADDHGEQPERELVELERGAEGADVDGDPDAEPHRVDVDELEGAGEVGDLVGGPVLGPHQGADEGLLVAGLVVLDLVEVAVFDAVGPVDDLTGRTGVRVVMRGGHAV